MEGKLNTEKNMIMGDVVLSPSPSPLQQQNFSDSVTSAASSATSVSTVLEIAKSVVRMPTITFGKAITEHTGGCGSSQQEESEEDLQDLDLHLLGKEQNRTIKCTKNGAIKCTKNGTIKRTKNGKVNGKVRSRFYRVWSTYCVGGNYNRKKGFRKRKKSIHGCGGGDRNDGNYMPPYKQRRLFRRNISCPSIAGKGNGGGGIKTPLKFLLGGNAHDPLNLNGLGDSDNAVTPRTSPMPLPNNNSSEIPIMIPKNYRDPLRLMSEEDVENTRDVIEGILPATQKQPHKRRRHRKRSLRKRNESECSMESIASEKSEAEGDAESEAAEVINKNQIGELHDDPSPKACKPKGSKVQDSKTTEDKAVTQPEGTRSKGKGKEEEAPNEQGEDVKCQVVTNGPVITPAATPSEQKVEPETVPTGPELPYPFRVSSDYIPLSSHYQPSPFVIDTMNENFTVLPFESPSMSNYMGTQDTFTITEPFSPPPPRSMDVQLEHRVPSGHYGLGWTPPRNEIVRRQLPPQQSIKQQAMFNRRHRNRLDPIVSPVFPNFGTGKRNWVPHAHPRHKNHKNQEAKVEEKKNGGEKSKEVVPKRQNVGQGQNIAESAKAKYNPKGSIFRYGNYNQYYGYRNPGYAEDARLRAFKKEWLEGKDVLDIGCNVGHVTLSLGRDCAPRRIVGIDIDGYLIKVAKKNIKHYVDRDPSDVSIKFPLALSIVHGSLQPPQMEAVGRTPEYGGGSSMTPTSSGTGSQSLFERKRIPFPYNVAFKQENYVLEADEFLSTVKPQYDVVICLSTTKWVHLNFGDDGLKRFFRRAYLNLRAGGIFVLEPQPWTSYRKKKKMTEEIFKISQGIKFFPKDFEAFLLKDVGYTSVKLVGIPAHHSKGFQRPIFVFTKGPAKPAPSATVTSEDQRPMHPQPMDSQPMDPQPMDPQPMDPQPMDPQPMNEPQRMDVMNSTIPHGQVSDPPPDDKEMK